MITAPVYAEAAQGEVAVIGLGKSGRAVAALLARDGLRVYASDSDAGEALARTASSLRSLGISVDTGGHDLDRIAASRLVVVSPGVPPQAAALVRARQRGIPVVAEIEVALRHLTGTRYIAVTGTNGKTTTTALVGHLLRALGHDAVDAGNIGMPLAELALRGTSPPWVALELSSFQLHDTPGIAPTVGVLTNLSPDHLDRYSSVEEYYADKARLFANARPESRWVVNADDEAVLAMARSAPGHHYRFSVADGGADAQLDRARGSLHVLGAPLLARSELALFGDHNVANALAAALSVMVADAAHRTEESRRRIAEGLRSFRALAHRLEIAGEFDGVMWINDSKATNVSSTRVAVAGMTRPTILLLGGRHKGEPYTALIEPLRKVGKVVLAYGEAAPLIEADLGGLVPVERLGSSFEEVIARARARAEAGDVVLLSPACSSYDMFLNYEERGTEFKRLAASDPPR